MKKQTDGQKAMVYTSYVIGCFAVMFLVVCASANVLNSAVITVFVIALVIAVILAIIGGAFNAENGELGIQGVGDNNIEHTTFDTFDIDTSPFIIQNNTSNLDEIAKLKNLLDTNAITQDEFDKLKTELLNK